MKPNPKPFQFSLKEKEIKNIKLSSQFVRKKKKPYVQAGLEGRKKKGLKYVT